MAPAGACLQPFVRLVEIIIPMNQDPPGAIGFKHPGSLCACIPLSRSGDEPVPQTCYSGRTIPDTEIGHEQICLLIRDKTVMNLVP